MADITKERKASKLGTIGVLPEFTFAKAENVAASTKILAGALVAVDSSGNLVSAGVAGAVRVVGVSEQSKDNTGGSAGDLTVTSVRTGCFAFANSSAGDAIARANIGQICYVVDNQTVALTSNSGARIPAGVVWDVDTDDSLVWVVVGPGLAALGVSAEAYNYAMPADAAATTATAETAVQRVVAAGTISSLSFTPTAAVTASDTVYATVTVAWRDGAGGAAKTIGSFTTKVTGGSGNLSAFTTYAVTGLTNTVVPANAVITLTIAKASTGTQLPASVVSVNINHVTA